jgi:glycosyltransferase involved in cell wall biosynthesis
MSDTLAITAVVLANNEEKSIARCLQSLQWVDEVRVIDSGSVDDTPKIAQSFSNVVFEQIEWLGYAATKQYAVDKAKNDVIFWVDSDEEIPSELQQEIKAKWEVINQKWEQVPIYTLPRKTFFMGEWIKYCGWYPDRQKRLFNRKFAKFNSADVHEDVTITNTGKLGNLDCDILHYSFQSIEKYFEKMNKYGKLGAKEMKNKEKKVAFSKLIFNPLWSFFQSYFLRLGVLQGKTGFIISCGNAYSKFIKYTHFYYLDKE